MIHFRQGDLFKSGAECLVNAVNCEGVSGAGIAKQFKKRFPQNQAFYEAECKQHNLMPGGILTFHEGNFWIANAASKRSWRDKSQIEDVRKALTALADWCISASIRSIAIPALGCGLGGLPWSKVKPEIEKAFEDSTAEVFVYEPL